MLAPILVVACVRVYRQVVHYMDICVDYNVDDDAFVVCDVYYYY